jgi:hypothetical protein
MKTGTAWQGAARRQPGTEADDQQPARGRQDSAARRDGTRAPRWFILAAVFAHRAMASIATSDSGIAILLSRWKGFVPPLRDRPR